MTKGQVLTYVARFYSLSSLTTKIQHRISDYYCVVLRQTWVPRVLGYKAKDVIQKHC
jgi:hypothetical protein